MKRFENMGVFLKDSPADDAVLEFAAHMAHLGIRQMHCIHVHDAAPGGVETDPDLTELRAKVAAALPSDLLDQTVCEVKPGTNLVEVLKAARDKDMGLIIVGRRLPSSQMGMGAKITRIVRKAPCSVMVVPELCQPRFARILVAVDHSQHSKLSMEAAVALVKASGNPDARLLALTIRSVAARPELVGLTFDEAAAKQQAFGQKDIDRFLSGIETHGIPVESLVVLSDDPAAAITHVAMAKRVDIVVTGSRGATRPAAILLGATAEKLLMDCAMPILVVKEKGETTHLLEAIFAAG